MVNISLSYLAGVVTIAGVVYAAGGRVTLATFSAGVLLTLLALLALLWSPSRLRATARILARLADVFDPKPLRAPSIKIDKLAVVNGPIEAELVSGLLDLGAKKRPAIAAARQAIELEPSGSFDSLFRSAVRFVREAA